jgi:DNA-binding CsgD family transcriptional regulator
MLDRDLFDYRRQLDVPPVSEPLTPAEKRIGAYREIAQQSYLSLSSVRTHARHLRDKLGSSIRAEAAAKVRELGLLSRSGRARHRRYGAPRPG